MNRNEYPSRFQYRSCLPILALTLALLLSNARAQTIWIGPATGDWTDNASWSTSTNPGAGEDVQIDGDNADQDSAVTLNASRSIGTLAVSDGDSLTFANNRDLTVTGDSIMNDGLIDIAATANGTNLSVNGPDTVLSGSGRLRLSGANARIVGSGSLINQSNLEGLGSVGVNGLSLTNTATGTVDANDTEGGQLILDPPQPTGLGNSGTLQASGGGVLTLTGNGGGAFDNAGGTIQALAGSRVQLEASASIEGGTLTTVGDGLFGIVSGAFSNLTNMGNVVIENNRRLQLFGEIDNRGEILVAAEANGTDLDPRGPITISGGGAVRLSGANARILGTGMLTNTNHTIRGEGNFGSNGSGLINGAGGVVVADVSGAVLTLDPSSTDGAMNTNILQASDGGILSLSGNGGGGFSNAGGTIHALEGSRVQLVNNATIEGGTLATTGDGAIAVINGSLSSLTNSGRVIVENNRALRLFGEIDNRGEILVAAEANGTDLDPRGPVTLSGGGAVTLSGQRARVLGSGVLSNTNHTVRGQGELREQRAGDKQRPGWSDRCQRQWRSSGH